MSIVKRSLEERLEVLKTTIEQPNFRRTSGKANEVNYWVFDYDPADELRVRAFIKELEIKENNGKKPFQLVVFDLYDIIIDYLESKKFLNRCKVIEEKKGFDEIIKAIKNSIRINEKNNFIVNYITNHTPDNAIIFITGVGKCYPFLQGPEVFDKILYYMPSRFTSTPMVLFYPGTYTEQELIVFNEYKTKDYYRAFRIAR